MTNITLNIRLISHKYPIIGPAHLYSVGRTPEEADTPATKWLTSLLNDERCHHAEHAVC